MIAKLQNTPNPWIASTEHQVNVRIAGAPAGQAVNVDLFLTLPAPEQLLEHRIVGIDNAGGAIVSFHVTLTTRGINVLHCEATRAGDFDSDSTGTIVT